MKTITTTRKANKMEIQPNAINILSSAELKSYLDIASKFISEESINIINWLIVNDDYAQILGGDKSNNPLFVFYKNGMPSDENLKELYDCLKKVVSGGRILEIPLFQTKQQFNDIVNKTKSVDSIILDFDSEQGRTYITKRYEPLVHKLCRQWVGKINLQYNDLLSVAYEGLVYAMNTYGKKNSKSKAEDSKIINFTFGQYAAWCIRNHILGYGVSDSHLIKVTKTQQKKEKEEKGYNTKNFSVSGDKVVGHNDEGSKTMFDFMGSTEDVELNINKKDEDVLWDSLFKELHKEFDDKTIDIWASFWGIFNHKQMKNKDIAKKYGISNGNVSYYCFKVNSFIKKNPKLKKLGTELYELMKENLNDAEIEKDNNKYRYVKHSSVNNDEMDD